MSLSIEGVVVPVAGGRTISATARPYLAVNAQWPRPAKELPELDPKEAVSAARRLWRFTMKQAWRGKIVTTSGNRRGVRIRGTTMIVNPDRGWWGLVHSMSHRCAFRLYPGRWPHDFRHAYLEKAMIEYVVKNGWLEGKLRRPERSTPTRDLKRKRYNQVLDRLKAWTSKKKRAETALRKLNRRRRYYEKLLGLTVTA